MFTQLSAILVYVAAESAAVVAATAAAALTVVNEKLWPVSLHLLVTLIPCVRVHIYALCLCEVCVCV